MQKILIIEDDLGISSSLKMYLENSNFKADIHSSGAKAIEKIKETKPDLVILDINLPEKDGITICKELRDFSQTPVIMLTAKSSESNRIAGLEIGADDYVAKPFSPRELLVRIKAVLRRINSEEKDENLLVYKEIKLDITKRTVCNGSSQVSLTKNEYDLLEKIITSDGKLLTREDLMTKVLGYEKYIYDRTLDTHIKNLRRKIGVENVILTVRGEGYRLNK